MGKKKAGNDPKTFGYRVVVLHFGYVESSSVACMTLIRQSGDAEAMTKAAAVRSVAKFFFHKWLEEHEWPPSRKKCCDATQKKDAEAKFCAKCGEKIELPEFDHEEYSHWVNSQLHQTADDWGGFEGEWWPWNSVAEVVDMHCSGFKCLEIHEHAGEILTWALDPDAEWFPASFKEGLRTLQSEVKEHHADNRLSKMGLDIDGLLERDAKTFAELCKDLADE